MSYLGDIRFWFGAENPRKVENIVEGNYKYLLEIYTKLLGELGFVLKSDECLTLPSHAVLLKLWETHMPSAMRSEIASMGLAGGEALRAQVAFAERRIKAINRKGSFKGILGGVFSTDVSKSLAYLFEKLAKGIFKKKS